MRVWNFCLIISLFFYTACASSLLSTTEKENLIIYRVNLNVFNEKIERNPANTQLYYERGEYL
jgi:hypothetical protein